MEEFLQLPETKPASEFINGQVKKKPMPQGEHSRLQAKLFDTLRPKVRRFLPQRVLSSTAS